MLDRRFTNLLGAAACFLLWSCNEPPRFATAEPPQVRIAPVSRLGSTEAIEATGTVAWRRETPLGFALAGELATVAVNEGDRVKPGQLLASLDKTSVSAALARSTAERDRAESELERLEVLYQEGWVTRGQIERLRTAVQVAQADVATDLFQQRNASIIARGAGIVLSRIAEPGQIVGAGVPVLILGEVAGGMVLRVSLAGKDLSAIKEGAAVEVSLADGRTLKGSVQEIPGQADPRTGTFLVEIALPSAPGLRSGDLARAKISSQRPSAAAFAIPSSAVFSARADQGFVFIVDRKNNRVRRRMVEISETTDTAIVVSEGVTDADWVAVSRIDRLQDDMRISPIGRPR